MFVSILTNLLLINLIVVLAHESGFFISLDEWVSSKWKFHHLPKIMMCALCQTNWLSILYILVTGQFTLFALMLCLINAHLTEITLPLVRTIKSLFMKILELINKLIDLL